MSDAMHNKIFVQWILYIKSRHKNYVRNEKQKKKCLEDYILTRSSLGRLQLNAKFNLFCDKRTFNVSVKKNKGLIIDDN